MTVDIAVARTIIDQATPGPWTDAPLGGEWEGAVLSAEDDVVCEAISGADRAFIAAARSGWPQALDALEAERETRSAMGIDYDVLLGRCETAEAERDVLRAQLDAVLAEHPIAVDPLEGWPETCDACDVEWPCPTVRAASPDPKDSK